MRIRFRFHKGKTVMVLEMHVPRRFSFRLHEIVPLNKNELWHVIAVGHEGFASTIDAVELVD
jgi:hypothetical protein